MNMDGCHEFDGTLTGLLTVAASVMNSGSHPESITVRSAENGGAGQGELFSARAVASDKTLAAEVVTRLKMGEDKDAMRDVQSAFHHNHPERWTWIVRFLVLALREPKRARDRRLPAVVALRRFAREVRQETHRLNGLIRFQELSDGMLWATITPDHDVVGLVYPCFRRRMPGETWAIYDAGRGRGLKHRPDNGHPETVLVPEPLRRELQRSGELPQSVAPSDPYFELWRTFFAAIAIEGRRNPEQQRRCMPARYWRNLPEKSR